MTLKDTIKGHWAVFDGVEEVTLGRKYPTAANVTGVKALQRALSLGQLAYYGSTLGIDPASVVWHLWEDPALTAAGAKVGVEDTITTAGGKVYTIKQVTYSNQTSRYRCLAVPNR